MKCMEYSRKQRNQVLHAAINILRLLTTELTEEERPTNIKPNKRDDTMKQSQRKKRRKACVIDVISEPNVIAYDRARRPVPFFGGSGAGSSAAVRTLHPGTKRAPCAYRFAWLPGTERLSERAHAPTSCSVEAQDSRATLYTGYDRQRVSGASGACALSLYITT